MIKAFILLLLVAVSCTAQEIRVNQVSAEAMLGYLDIKPTDVAYTNFTVTLPSKMYGALEFRKTAAGKAPEVKLLPLGPASEFTIEVFLDKKDFATQTRIVKHKFTAGGTSVVGRQVIVLGPPTMSLPVEYSIGPALPIVFTYNTGVTTHTISFISSKLPLKR